MQGKYIHHITYVLSGHHIGPNVWPIGRGHQRLDGRDLFGSVAQDPQDEEDGSRLARSRRTRRSALDRKLELRSGKTFEILEAYCTFVQCRLAQIDDPFKHFRISLMICSYAFMK